MANLIKIDKLNQDFKSISLYILHLINVHSAAHADVVQWIDENLSGLWSYCEFDDPIFNMETLNTNGLCIQFKSIHGICYYFNDTNDYMAFKLRWS
ncbi:hypothetical protein LCGC14_2263850 [marine sediment metagenome]|uniref:Uncharacterized protein n=1 Tax=marine sediment metagenome TaxID=412755 RepID=A0A0F9FB97_9ZZZZ